jgi:hypothetical protein
VIASPSRQRPGTTIFIYVNDEVIGFGDQVRDVGSNWLPQELICCAATRMRMAQSCQSGMSAHRSRLGVKTESKYSL